MRWCVREAIKRYLSSRYEIGTHGNSLRIADPSCYNECGHHRPHAHLASNDMSPAPNTTHVAMKHSLLTSRFFSG